MRIVGITGTLGAGKGTVVDFLVTQHNYAHYSARTLLTSLVKEQKLELNRNSLVAVANELRAKEGPAAVVEALLKQALAATAHGGGAGAIIESVRTPGEVERLKAVGGERFQLLAVDADQTERWRRVVQRKSATDAVSLERFAADEQREMESTQPHEQQLKAVMAMADFRVSNDGSERELQEAVASALQLDAPSDQ